MTLPESQTPEKNLVFIGAPRAGKTCLIAAWYQFLECHPSIRIEKVEDPDEREAIRLLDLWKNIRDGGTPPRPTEVGECRKYSVTFSYQGRYHTFKFVDYAGETVTKAFSGELNDPAFQEEVISTCKSADRLFLVINLEDYLRQNRNPLSDVLIFLAQVAGRHDFGLLFQTGLTIYLSHPEKLSRRERRECVSEISQKLQQALPSFSLDSVVLGATVREIEEGKVTFAAENARFSPTRHFHHVIADLVKEAGNNGEGRLDVWLNWLWQTKYGRCVLVGLVLLSLGGWFGFAQFQNYRVETEWQEHRANFIELEDHEVNEATDASATLDELADWERTANQEFRDQLLRDEYDQRARALRQDLEAQRDASVGDPSRVRTEVQTIVSRHGTNYRRIYPEIIQRAEQALANQESWSIDARNDWRAVRDFIGQLQDGVRIELVEPSFWVSGNDTLQLELHIFEQGQSAPYGSEATPPTVMKGIILAFHSDPIKGNENRYRYVWADSYRSNHLFRPESDRIDLRIVRQHRPARRGFRMTETEVLRWEISLSEIHGLGWLNAERTLTVGESEYVFNFSQYRILDRSGEPLEVPGVFTGVR